MRRRPNPFRQPVEIHGVQCELRSVRDGYTVAEVHAGRCLAKHARRLMAVAIAAQVIREKCPPPIP